MKINRTTIYNIQNISALGSNEGSLTGMMFCKRPNLLERDDYANAKLRNFFELEFIFKPKMCYESQNMHL